MLIVFTKDYICHSHKLKSRLCRDFQHMSAASRRHFGRACLGQQRILLFFLLSLLLFSLFSLFLLSLFLLSSLSSLLLFLLSWVLFSEDNMYPRRRASL